MKSIEKTENVITIEDGTIEGTWNSYRRTYTRRELKKC